MAESEEQKKSEEEKRLHVTKLREAEAKERARRYQEVDIIEQYYDK